jgi:hypothetical protein
VLGYCERGRLVPDCFVSVNSLVRSDRVFRKRSMWGLSFVRPFGRALLGILLLDFLQLVVHICFLLGGNLPLRLLERAFFLEKYP